MNNTTKKEASIIISVIIIGMTIFFFGNDLKELVRIYSNAKYTEDMIKSYGNLGVIIFIFLQVLQVIVFFIPGEFMQAVGGYLYHTFLGIILSFIGISIGSGLTFIIARRYGDELLKKILPKKDHHTIKSLIDKPKNRLIIFLLYLFPGFPKDALGYVAGITSISFRDFLLISSISRLPGIVVTCYLGSNIFDENYMVVLYIIVAVAILLIIGVIYKDKFIKYLK